MRTPRWCLPSTLTYVINPQLPLFATDVQADPPGAMSRNYLLTKRLCDFASSVKRWHCRCTGSSRPKEVWKVGKVRQDQDLKHRLPIRVMGATNRSDEWRGVLWGAPRAEIGIEHHSGELSGRGSSSPRTLADEGIARHLRFDSTLGLLAGKKRVFLKWALGPSRGGCRWADRPPSVAGHKI